MMGFTTLYFRMVKGPTLSKLGMSGFDGDVMGCIMWGSPFLNGPSDKTIFHLNCSLEVEVK